MDPFLQLLLFVYYVLFYGIPSVLFYGCIIVFGRKAWRSYQRGEKNQAATFALTAIAPILWFSAILAAAIVRNAHLEASVSSGEHLPKLAAEVPRVLVAHSGRSDWQDRLVEMGAFDTIYVQWPAGAVRVEIGRRTGCDGGARGNVSSQNIFLARAGFLVCARETKVDSVPAEGLHYYSGGPPMTGGRFLWRGHYELKLVENGRERLIGFNGTPMLHYPVPILSIMGFVEYEIAKEHIVPWYGEIPFLFGRLGLDISKLKPQAQPSAEEVRAEFLRLSNSPERVDQRVAGYIATAVGNSLLSADDIAPILKSNAVDTDFAREIGYEQFCYRINRLCDFPDELVVACKDKRSYLPESVPYRAAALRRCERLPRQCTWCRETPQCRPVLDGKTNACSPEMDKVREEGLRPLRESEN